MKNNILFFLVIIPLTCSIYINYLLNESLIEQTILLYDYNNFQLNFPTDDVLTFNHTFPNITVTGLPIAAMKARYLLKDSINNEAVGLLNISKKANPYIGFSEYELSKYFFEKNIDSAYFYSKIAFSSLPKNVYHTQSYFKTLLKLKKEKELDSAFSLIKDFNEMAQWQFYIFNKLEFNNPNRESLKSLVKDAELYVDDPMQLSTLRALVNIGFEGLSKVESIVLNAEKLYDQKNFILSAINFIRAAELSPTRYNYYENAALAYYLGGELEEARKLFKYVLRNFQTNRNGKSEFYLGILEIENDNKDQGCIFLNQAMQKNWGSRKVIENLCF